MGTCRPKTVITAVSLLGATLAVGLVQMLVFVRDTDLAVDPALPYGITVVLYAAFALLLYQIFRGKDWARILYTAVLVLGFLQMAAALPNLLRAPGANVFALAVVAAKVAAVILLYVPASNAWFRRQDSSNNSSKPTPLRGAA